MNKLFTSIAAASLSAAVLSAAQTFAQSPVGPMTPAPADGARPTIVPLDIFTVPNGLEVTLWAQSPMLKNPTNIDIDAAGRIWVTEGVNYRRHATRDPKGDRVVILEDTDKDGRADQSTVFVQEPTLVAPLGMSVIDNQIIVSNAPDLIVYTDANRDLRFDPAMDRREVLLTGFDGRNHDHALHSVTVGPDGRWYFSQGNAGAFFTDRGGKTFRVGSAYNPVPDGGAQPVFGNPPLSYAGAKSDDGHVYVGGFAARMQPDGRGVEIIGYNFRNSYEHTVTSFGDLFQNDNDDPPACRTTYLMEYGNAGWFSRDGKRYWQADRRPGQSIPVAEWRQEDPGVIPSGDVYGGGAPTGIVFNEGDGLGKKYRGLLLSAEAARNTIFGYFPRPEGAGYRLDRFDFLTSNTAQAFAGTDFKGGKVNSEIQTFFRPSDVAVGPDGAIYVADWFDPRVGGHDDKDDTTSGAIYRIAPKGFKSVVPAFDTGTVEGQVTALRSPAVNVRALGAKALAARGAAAIPAVEKLLSDENPYIRARAVWLLARLGPEGVARAAKLLNDPDAGMRVAAYRAIRQAGESLTYAGALAHDASPAVRREVGLSLRDVPFEKAGHLLLELAKGYDGKDRSYLEAWGIGATGKEAQLYSALIDARDTSGARPARDAAQWPAAFADLVWRLTPAAAVPAFLQRAQATSLPAAERTKAITALGFIPTREAANALLDVAQGGAKDFRANPALWWLLNYKDSRWVDAGVDAELKKRALFDPDSVQVNEVTVPEAPAPMLKVADIVKLRGDAKRGGAAAQACQMCHRINGQGTDYAPDLSAFATRQTREVVATAIVNPSNDIAHGYEGAEITLTDGRKIHGLVLSGGNPLIVQSTGGVTQMIPATMVKERKRLGRSLMLSADQLGLTAQQVADIVAYLR
ncbi:MAG TPA: PVC-type heme-binding CxxCH protein [Steroidobacteraceae bacterium]|nr:PVC-type heme-binding CxxCH protein [Steroidobacteraceae bacterium]